MSNTDDKLFYVGQKAFIDKNGEVLVLNDPVHGLDFPGGKIQEMDVALDEALHREVLEETNLEIEIGEPFFRWYKEFPVGHRNEGKQVYLIGFKCKYKDGEVKLSDEHDNFKWVNKNNFREVEVANPYFKALEKYFKGS